MNLARSAMAVFATATFAVAAASQTPRDHIAGSWTGTIVLGAQEQPIRFWFKGQGHRQGNLQIMGLMSRPNALSDVTLRDGTVSFTWNSTPSQRFVGRLNGDTLRGNVTIEGLEQRFTFDVRRDQ